MKKTNQKPTRSFRVDPVIEQQLQSLLAKSGTKNISEFINLLLRYGLKLHGNEFTQKTFATYKGRPGKFINDKGGDYEVPMNAYEDVVDIYEATFRAFELMVKKFGYDYAPVKPNQQSSNPGSPAQPNNSAPQSASAQPNSDEPKSDSGVVKPTDEEEGEPSI